MNKQLIIYGAGKNGKRIAINNYLSTPPHLIVDGDKQKQGSWFCGCEIISPEQLLELKSLDDYEIILSTDNDAIRQYLKENNIEFWEAQGTRENNYFQRRDIRDYMDSRLLEKFYGDYHLKNSLYHVSNYDIFRTEYYSKLNQEIVEAMQEKDENRVNDIFEQIYVEYEPGWDEQFLNRPGMRLASMIIHDKVVRQGSICEFACGHGELLQHLKQEGYDVIGVELSNLRCRYLEEHGIDYRCADVEKTGLPGDAYDAVICQECLEHVKNPISVLLEIKRVLKKDGVALISVPLGKYCDCDTHVRHFEPSVLSSMMIECGFKMVNILEVPYLNWEYNNNIFAVGEKMDE